MTFQQLLNKNIVTATLTGAVLLSAAVPGGISYGAAAQSSAPLDFQIGSYKSIDYRGEHSLSVAPYLINGIAMVPVRALAEGLQATIDWDPATKGITLNRNGVTVHLTQNSNKVVSTNSQNIKLSANVVVLKGNAIVPVREVAKLLGAETIWNAKQKKITIQTSQAGLALEYTFNQNEEGWKGAFADYPADYNPSIYGLEFARKFLPTAANKTNFGLMLKGVNRSDDLFMFVTKKIEGLKPNTTYDASLSFLLYTDVPAAMMGVGGSPGESVAIKAGFVSKAPMSVLDKTDNHYRLNIDKGNQLTDGKDMKIIGNMVQPNDKLKGFQAVAMQHKATLKSNEKGELYVVIGSDSGYEGLTTLYLDDMKIKLQPQE